MSFDPNSPHTQRVNLIVAMVNRLRLVYRLLRDPRVPLFTKVIPFASLVYVILPVDFVPDVIPVLGQLDDLGVVLLAIETFIFMAPQNVVQEHRNAIEHETKQGVHEDTVVDGEWHTVNRNK